MQYRTLMIGEEVSIEKKPSSEILRRLLALGQFGNHPKWSQWEEVVLAKELLDEIDLSGYHILTSEDVLKIGDEFKMRDERSWGKVSKNYEELGHQIEGINARRLRFSLRTVRFRRQTHSSKQPTPEMEHRIIKAIDGLVSLRYSEGYGGWHIEITVIEAEILMKGEHHVA